MKKNEILFSGDTLFRLGCGRVFESTFKIMHKSLIKIRNIKDSTMVYCGHEYTLNNLNFLISIFPNHIDLRSEKKKIKMQISETKSSIPFNLGEEKKINPFLSSKSKYYENFKKNNNFNDFEMFTYLRDTKDHF